MKILFFANTDWYLFNFRLALAKHLRDLGAEVVMVSPSGPYGKKIEAEGFCWIPVPMARRSLNPLREAKLLWRLIRIYRKENPDIVHHFTIKCVVYGGLAAGMARVRGVVNAVTGLGYVFTSNDLLAKVLRPWLRWLLSLVVSGLNRRLILQNLDDRQAFLSARLIKEKFIRVIAGSGVDTQRFQPNSLHALVSGQLPKVVFAARLLEDKGVSEFIDAAQKIRSAGIKAEFVVAGEPDPGNPTSIPDETLTKWRKEGAVTFVGHVADMAAFLKDVDVMVLPSYYREGVPRNLIEAAAAGLPIVTTNIPGCREVVEDGVNGFLVPARDSNALAEAVIKILKDPVLAARMGAAGRAKVLAEFDERLVFEQTVKVYDELLGKPWPSSAGSKRI